MKLVIVMVVVCFMLMACPESGTPTVSKECQGAKDAVIVAEALVAMVCPVAEKAIDLSKIDKCDAAKKGLIAAKAAEAILCK